MRQISKNSFCLSIGCWVRRTKQLSTVHWQLSIVFLFVLFTHTSFSQTWTLERCIDSALQNNLSLQQSTLKVEISERTLKGSKQSWLPNLNAGVSHGFNWGQTIDPFTNKFATQQVMYERLYVQSSFVLFAGLKNYYTIKADKIDVEIQQVELEIAQRNLKIDLTAAFFQVLLNKANRLLAQENRQSTLVQLNNEKELLKHKQSTTYKVMEIEAQYQQDEYALVKATNDWNYAKLILQQMISSTAIENFELKWSPPIENKNNVFNEHSIVTLPDIRKKELESQQLNYSIKSVKGNFFPSLSINGSLGSGYSQNNKFIAPSGALEPKPYFRQLGDNFYQSAFLTLNIPIFNQNSVQNKVKLMQLQAENTDIEQKKTRQELQQKLEQLQLDIQNTSMQIFALSDVCTADSLNFENQKTRYELGSSTYEKLIEAKTKLTQSKAALNQAIYELALKQKVAEYYEKK